MNRDDFEKLFLMEAGDVKAWAQTHGKAFACIVSFLAGLIVGAILF